MNLISCSENQYNKLTSNTADIFDTEPKQIMMHSGTQTKHAQQNMKVK